MKASALIMKLQALMDEVGDVELKVEGGYDGFMRVVDIETFEDEGTQEQILILVAEFEG